MIDLHRIYNSLRALIPACQFFLKNTTPSDIFTLLIEPCPIDPNVCSYLIDIVHASYVQKECGNDTWTAGLWEDLRGFFRELVDITSEFCHKMEEEKVDFDRLPEQLCWLNDLELGPNRKFKEKTHDESNLYSSDDDDSQPSPKTEEQTERTDSSLVQNETRRKAFILCFVGDDTSLITRKDLINLCVKLKLQSILESLNDEL
ncbi:hypothetical protein Ciccas_008498 [Cichlidogyrus casuarinus]|uniref:Uncharacterized protein n=1 Tax=Cichlidogyrus casuarinus TaxID=1844966 RepID=A0ABD2PZT1_9PLAT